MLHVATSRALSPFAGFAGEHVRRPSRKLVDNPVQDPHPPLWVAGKPDLAARHGMGCLGFNTLSCDMARKAVDHYYSILATECMPIGHAVNPAMAVLARVGGGQGNERRVAAMGSAAARLLRAYTAQVEALRRLRSAGQQSIRVEHVTVHDGGQAIVGNVSATGRPRHRGG